MPLGLIHGEGTSVGTINYKISPKVLQIYWTQQGKVISIMAHQVHTDFNQLATSR